MEAAAVARIVTVQVLRSNSPPVTCSYSCVTRSELSVEHRDGHLRDSEWNLVVRHDELPAGHYTYVCALDVLVVDTLRRLSDKAVLGSLGRGALEQWFAQQVKAMVDAREQPRTILGLYLMVDLVLNGDQSWLDGLFRAIGETYKTDALPAIIEYVSASDVLRPVVYPDSVAKVLEEGWRRRFEDPCGVVDYIFKQLEAHVKSFVDRSYYAAWTVMIQSSGWGKSRTICQLSTKGVYVVYISFMRTGWSGIPKRSPLAKLVSGGAGGADPWCIAAWIFALLREVSDAVEAGKTAEEWMGMQMEEKSAAEIAERVQKRYSDLRKEVEEVKAKLPAPHRDEQWNSAGLQTWVSTHTDKLSGQPKILICIDEAASFFQDIPGSFLATRRFFSCIKRGSWIFGLVTDTAGKLGLIFPEKMYDPSARAAAPGAKFFAPIWLVGNLWGDGKKLKQLMESRQGDDPTIFSEEVSRELFKWGRPLWRSALERGESGAEALLDEVVEFAIQKLLGGTRLTDVEKMTDAMAMAVLGVTAGLEVVAWSDLAKDMVAGHMRTVSYIAEERDRVFSADALEPILGEAAARILKTKLSEVLKVAQGVFKQAFVVEGPRGEIVGRLIMVLAMHACNSSRMTSYNLYSHPVKLGVFLSKLCGTGLEADGLLCFNRFIMLDRKEITRRHLLICFICCVAIIPTRGQKAFDVLLPLLMPQPDGKYEPREDRMRGLPVQIRNRKSYSVDTRNLASFARQYNSSSEGVEGSEKGEKESSVEEANVGATTEKTEKGIEEEEAESEEDPDYDPKKDPDYVSEAEPEPEPELKKRRLLEEVTKLEGPVSIYMHLGGQNKSKSHELDENGHVLILHRTEFAFLPSADLEALENLRLAFFKIEDHLTIEERGILRHNLSNYLKPTDFNRLTVEDLRKEATALGVPDGGLKQDLVARLENLGLGDPFSELCGGP